MYWIQVKMFWFFVVVGFFIPSSSPSQAPVTEQNPLPECSEVLCIAHGGVQASGPGHVHVEPLSGSRAHLNPTLRLEFETSAHKRAFPSAHPPQPESRCRGRSSRRHSDGARCRGRWGRCKILPEYRCHGEHPKHQTGEDEATLLKVVSKASHRRRSYPVHYEDLADAELVLQLLGCDGHRIEVTKTPKKQSGTKSYNLHLLDTVEEFKDTLTLDWRGRRDDPAVWPQQSRSGRKIKNSLVCVSLRGTLCYWVFSDTLNILVQNYPFQYHVVGKRGNNKKKVCVKVKKYHKKWQVFLHLEQIHKKYFFFL